MRHDTLVLVLLWHETSNLLRAIGAFDRIIFVIAGGALLLTQAEDAFAALRVRASAIAGAEWLWHLALPGAAVIAGFAASAMATGWARSRAHAPYLASLPLCARARRRMVVTAELCLGGIFALWVGLLLGLVCGIVHKPGAIACGCGDAVLSGLGVAGGLVSRLRTGAGPGSLPAEQRGRTLRLPLLGRLDRAQPAWLGSWACGLPAGRLPLTAPICLAILVLGAVAMLASGASLAQHAAAPAVVAGIAGGLVVFMLCLRCRPLGSPVLRAAPLAFTRGWLGVMRLPLALSTMYFALPAGIAVAAQPHAWAMPVGGGFSLLLLDAVYAVFAAYFLMTPLFAALSFFAVLTYAAVKSLEYHDVAYFCLAAFLVLLWRRARRRFLHG